MSENRFMGTLSASSIRNLLPRSLSNKRKTSNKSSLNSENIPPLTDPNIQSSNLAPTIKKSPIKVQNLRERIVESDPVAVVSDPSVKVVVRIRAVKSKEGLGDFSVRNISDDSILVEERKFKFDSVLNSNSKQEDVFELVGVPLVKNTLAGYNTSILAYGQTGSGKSYTMWGPPSAMLETNIANGQQGVAPRIFQMLFSEIQREQEISEDKQINYQCRCSFLEIYNEQIGDLLDPTQRNLKIKDDTKTGFYVENLTEEYVGSYEDVTQILIKGLSSRKVGATSINSKSSRSHVVFTCIVESWCKNTTAKCFSSTKTSRITLVDLAGLERTTLDDAGKQCIKEGKYVKKSISQLGHLVNILSESTQSSKTEAIPYESSCLTHILRESLGGNAKLSIICAISPDNKCSTETVSTLRFGMRAKSILNHPVINEITEDDVNGLSDQIRQLKEELIRTKSNDCKSPSSNYGKFGGHSARESLNQLRVSINRSLILPRIEDDSEKEVHIDADDIKKLSLQLDNLQNSMEDLTSEQYISCSDDSEKDENSSDEFHTSLSHQNSFSSFDGRESIASRSSISINARRQSQSAVLEEPALSDSPKIGNAALRRSVMFSSSHLAGPENLSDSSKFTSDILRQSRVGNDHLRSSLRSSKIIPGSESLAASLKRGVQIIDLHQRNSASMKDSVEFSFEHFALKSCQTIDKANSSVHTLPEERQSSDRSLTRFLCTACNQTVTSASSDVQNSSNTSLSRRSNELADQMSMATDTKLADATKREKELETVCEQQKAEIEQLKLLVAQLKNQTPPNESTEHGNALPLEVLKNEIVPIQDPQPEQVPNNESKELLKQISCGNQETGMVNEQCDQESFDKDEKEALLKEIESLRSKTQSDSDASVRKSTARLRSSSLLLQSIQMRKSGAYSLGNSEEELENERQRWMEMESDWISLTDDLRIDLESIRQRAEKAEMELRLEKKCTEELDDVLKRSVLGHARMIEHYAELQEKYMDLVSKHRSIMEGVAEVNRAAAKAGGKGKSRFAKSLAAELSVLRVERDRERDSLRKENRSLKIQLRDTAEAVHAAGELLVRLKEAEEAASVAEENFTKVDEENDKLKKQVEKLKRKHKMEMVTMKQYLAESRLPEAALRPLFREDSDLAHHDDITSTTHDDDQAWRAEFGAIYQDQY
ncbi:kinesin-like protein KIN-12F [Heracleum sosnowskyi]|uniref:Kinesin-like protein KIN-12F n=1 Tax=Heracleum sosnowskyi TaxID=360622 RepID=A0AAD8JIB5_9APIA|nr:kinesin-like protein KIN-12F [Heracleum sosnowskyi]